MNSNSSILEKIPLMKAGDELRKALTVLPDYDDSIRSESEATRLQQLSKLYDIYVATDMSVEIYTKLYVAMFESLKKKVGRMATIQRNHNHQGNIQESYSIYTPMYEGINGNVFSIIGNPGIGKSSAISRALDVMTDGQLIEVEYPHTTIVPCLVCQAPFDNSPKNLLWSILQRLDLHLKSDFFMRAQKLRMSTDTLQGYVSNLLMNHVGILIIDECQNLCNNNSGNRLISLLISLLNNASISISLVGTQESELFFRQNFALARRMLGLSYGSQIYDLSFKQFCKTVFDYQYVKHRNEITDTITEWLYEHTNGVPALIVHLLHEAQTVAILDGTEVLDLRALNKAYQQNMGLLSDFVRPSVPVKPKPIKSKKNNNVKFPVESIDKQEEVPTITDIANQAKKEKLDVIPLLRQFWMVTEVEI